MEPCGASVYDLFLFGVPSKVGSAAACTM